MENGTAKDHAVILVRIAGRVQGVAFRAWTRDEAARLGLSGWVRNEIDGSVTALFSGRKSAVETMTERLWRGPPAARVASVTVEDADPGSVPRRFEVRY